MPRRIARPGYHALVRARGLEWLGTDALGMHRPMTGCISHLWNLHDSKCLFSLRRGNHSNSDCHPKSYWPEPESVALQYRLHFPLRLRDGRSQSNILRGCAMHPLQGRSRGDGRNNQAVWPPISHFDFDSREWLFRELSTGAGLVVRRKRLHPLVLSLSASAKGGVLCTVASRARLRHLVGASFTLALRPRWAPIRKIIVSACIFSFARMPQFHGQAHLGSKRAADYVLCRSPGQGQLTRVERRTNRFVRQYMETGLCVP